MSKDISTIPGSIAKLNEESRQSGGLDEVRVLTDISGSMDSGFAHGGGTKSQASQNALDVLWSSSDWSICNMRVFACDSAVEEIPCSEMLKPVVPGPRGGTYFSIWLKAALEDAETTRIILCSDGQSEFPETEIARCIERCIPVDTIYIQSAGGFNREAEEALLRRISEETGGQFCTVDNAEALTQAFAALETSQRLLLEGPAEEVIKL